MTPETFSEIRQSFRDYDMRIIMEGGEPGLLPRPLMAQIVAAVADAYKVPWHKIIGRQRAAYYVEPRHVAMHLCRKMTGYSLPRIGRLFERDHTTVMHACQRVAERMEAEDDFAARVLEIAAACRRAG